MTRRNLTFEEVQDIIWEARYRRRHGLPPERYELPTEVDDPWSTAPPRKRRA